jgi:hypothetical protein
MKRLIVWSVVGFLLLLPLALLAVIALSFEDQPKIVRPVELSTEQIARAKRILKAHDPRNMSSGALRTFSIAAEDLDLALNFLLSQYRGSAKVALNPGSVMLWASAKSPVNLFGGYINVEAIAQQTSGLPAFDRLQIGRIPVPGFVPDWLLARALERLNDTAAGKTAADTVRSVRIAGGHLVVEYQWREDLPERLRSALLPPGDQERLRAYQDRLVELTSNPRLARQVSLLDLLRPLVAHAAVRSANADAAAENRAALLVLAFYVNGRGLAAIVPGAKGWPRAVPRKVTLAGRTDFSQHFTVSAALAATAGSPLADATGVYKEVEDSQGGSGFSFTDLAADRAGTVFGQQATRSVKTARALQARVGAGLVEADVLPRFKDLPEGLSEAEFKRRFGGVGAAPYARMLEEIERRVAKLALYR